MTRQEQGLISARSHGVNHEINSSKLTDNSFQGKRELPGSPAVESQGGVTGGEGRLLALLLTPALTSCVMLGTATEHLWTRFLHL